MLNVVEQVLIKSLCQDRWRVGAQIFDDMQGTSVFFVAEREQRAGFGHGNRLSLNRFLHISAMFLFSGKGKIIPDHAE